jgi:cytochrome c peroxidase
LPDGLETVLSVQAMFPPTSATEMAGLPGENAIADAAAVGDLAGPNGVWELLAQRLRDIPEYVDLFDAAYDDVDDASDITFVHAANAIAAFEAVTWRADNSPFDRYLRGNPSAMSPSARRGMRLFYGRAGCASCHSGVFQTDQGFHAIAMPQVGPGKGDGFDGREDFGLERVTGLASDRYKFRTPTLRNVALTSPYGHAGAYRSLEEVVLHHLDPVGSLESYDPASAMLPSRADLDVHDFVVQSDPARRAAIGAANELKPVSLSKREIQQLLEFLQALTDPASIDLRGDVPARVPSGAPIAD